MLDQIDSYFGAERTESLVFVAMGVVAIAFSIVAILKGSDAVLRGMAIPLVIVGLIQISVGAAILLRTDEQIADLKTLHANSATRFKG
jgi:predicted membrane channel-forming protein YqfA (hemolysin III family)